MKPGLSYLICSMPRTGSWLLAEALESTRIGGHPREFFAPELRQKFLAQWSLSPDTAFDVYLERAIAAATTPNGVFGVKVHWYQFADLVSNLSRLPGRERWSRAELLANTFPNIHYIHLTRRDKVRHAVSYAKAAQTQVWWELTSHQGGEQPGPAKKPVFDADQIDGLYRTIVAHEKCWRTYFRESGTSAFQIFYEDLSLDYAGTVRRVLQYLGLASSPRLNVARPRIKKQADRVSEIWVQRYRQLRNGKQTNHL